MAVQTFYVTQIGGFISRELSKKCWSFKCEHQLPCSLAWALYFAGFNEMLKARIICIFSEHLWQLPHHLVFHIRCFYKEKYSRVFNATAKSIPCNFSFYKKIIIDHTVWLESPTSPKALNVFLCELEQNCSQATGKLSLSVWHSSSSSEWAVMVACFS